MNQLSCVEARAILSEDGRFRYRLSRRWGPGPALLFVMLNPSTADAETDDPTIRKCVGFARRRGFDAIEVVNLFARRATDPRYIKAWAERVGPNNDEAIVFAAAACATIVFAWGAHPTGLLRAAEGPERVARVTALLSSRNRAPMCLGVTSDGSPRHPLMVRYDQPLMPWPPPLAAIAEAQAADAEGDA